MLDLLLDKIKELKQDKIKYEKKLDKLQENHEKEINKLQEPVKF